MSENARRIDKSEEERIKELARAAESGKQIFTPAEIFANKIVPRMLEEKPLSYFDSFHGADARLPLSCSLFPIILVKVCPLCSCNKDPSLIKPYLERGIVLPILSHCLAEYSSEFANLLVQYPYIGTYTRFFLKFMGPSSEDTVIACPHCYENEWKKIFDDISKSKLDKNIKDALKDFMQKVTKPVLVAPTKREITVLEQIKEAVSQKKIELLFPLTHKGVLLSLFRFARTFKAIPHVDQEDLSNINKISQEMGLPSNPNLVNDIQEKELTLRALNLNYNPKMPLEEYLDIILPRRSKISVLINRLIETKDKDKHLSQINDEIWEINREVASSKAIESLNFLTNLVTDNVNIIFSMLVGATIGYSSAEFAGCGLGSAGGLISGLVGKKISRHVGIKVPKYPKKTLEWVKTRIESPQERLLSIMLSKDIKAIQVWSLRKKLRKT